MTPENTESFVRSILGDDDLHPVTLTVNGQSWQGWQKGRLKEGAFKESDVFAAHLKTKANRDSVEQAWRLCHGRDIRLWINGTGSLFAIPQMPALAIPACERVGTHNSWDREEDALREVQDTLAEIYHHCPFEILYAGTASLNAAFLEPITRQQAEMFAELINRIAFETENEWLGELADRGEIEADENGVPQGNIQTLADCLQQKQALHLYWD
ncbi:hypothetical protein [Stenomitos frigidus]|uniref:DUF4253 domain-containing protein n=1 Tax=Stenomitos frigidus ULC18 TaxID=2107698 RepID=A0A2T1DVV2_9CYAN|nr:hypothetical protein [Stenomitos frigidus]PSB24617.1 hypothetical protein C7B82_26730 [Stenomitos frigidus ULC18]